MADGTEPKLRRPHPEEPNTLEQPMPAIAREAEPTEQSPESAAEAQDVATHVENKPSMSDRLSLRRKPKTVALPQVRDEVTVKIEKILEDGVGDAYSRLSAIQKQEFKIKGEAVAKQIREMLRSTHFKVKKILRLILEWLKMLPGVNRFFLEQEAKIKTDRIIALTKHQL